MTLSTRLWQGEERKFEGYVQVRSGIRSTSTDTVTLGLDNKAIESKIAELVQQAQ
jgi:hypothetical protein